MSRVSDWFGNTITQDVARPLPSTLPVSVFSVNLCSSAKLQMVGGGTLTIQRPTDAVRAT